MSYPPYNPYSVRNQNPSQGSFNRRWTDGPARGGWSGSGMGGWRPPRPVDSDFDFGSSPAPHGANKAPGRTFPDPPTNYRPDQRLAPGERDPKRSMEFREEAMPPPLSRGPRFLGAQRDEFPSTSRNRGGEPDEDGDGDSLSWLEICKKPAEDNKPARFGPPVSSDYLGGSDGGFFAPGRYDGPAPPRRDEPPLPRHAQELAAVLQRFGLEKDDLKYLLMFPEDQLNSDNVALILQKIGVMKEKRTPVRPEAYRDAATQPAKPAKVIDYGHTGGYSVGGQESGGGTGIIPNTYGGGGYREPLSQRPPVAMSGAPVPLPRPPFPPTGGVPPVRSFVPPPSISLPRMPLTQPVPPPPNLYPPFPPPQKDAYPPKEQAPPRIQAPGKVPPAFLPPPPVAPPLGEDGGFGRKPDGGFAGDPFKALKQLLVEAGQAKATDVQSLMAQNQRAAAELEKRAKEQKTAPPVLPQQPLFPFPPKAPAFPPAQILNAGLVNPQVFLQLLSSIPPPKMDAFNGQPGQSILGEYTPPNAPVFPYWCRLCDKKCDTMPEWVSHCATPLHHENFKLLRCPDPDGPTLIQHQRLSEENTSTQRRSRSRSRSSRRRRWRDRSSSSSRSRSRSRSRSFHRSHRKGRYADMSSSSHTYNPRHHHDSNSNKRHRSHRSRSRSPPSRHKPRPHRSRSRSREKQSKKEQTRQLSVKGPPVPRWKMTSAEKLAHRLLEASGVETLPKQPNLEFVVRSVSPTLVAELTKGKPPSSSSARHYPQDIKESRKLVKLRNISVEHRYIDLWNAMESFGEIESLLLDRDKDEATVLFKTESDAKKLRRTGRLEIKEETITVIPSSVSPPSSPTSKEQNKASASSSSPGDKAAEGPKESQPEKPSSEPEAQLKQEAKLPTKAASEDSGNSGQKTASEHGGTDSAEPNPAGPSSSDNHTGSAVGKSWLKLNNYYMDFETCLTIGDRLPSLLFKGSFRCFTKQKSTWITKGFFVRLFLISNLPDYNECSYTEDELAELFFPYGFIHEVDTIYCIPQCGLALGIMPSGDDLTYLMKEAWDGLSFKGKKLCIRPVSNNISMAPFPFYNAVMKLIHYGVRDDGGKTIFIHDISQREIQELREALIKNFSVRNFLPLLNKVFVEFVSITDVDLFGLSYSKHKKGRTHKVHRMKVPEIVYHPHGDFNCPSNIESPLWLTMKTNPYIFPTVIPWFDIPEYITVDDVSVIRAFMMQETNSRDSPFFTIMLTNLPVDNYRHEDVAGLVWPYFPEKTLGALFSNVLVLPLQRRAFIYFSQWASCLSFIQDHLKRPFKVQGWELSIFFVLRMKPPGPCEKTLYKNVMELSNCPVSDPDSVGSRLLSVETFDASPSVVTSVIKVVASISPFVDFLPLANRIYIEMVDTVAVAQVVEQIFVLEEVNEDENWYKVGRIEPLMMLQQRLKLNGHLEIYLDKPVESVRVKRQGKHKPKQKKKGKAASKAEKNPSDETAQDGEEPEPEVTHRVTRSATAAHRLAEIQSFQEDDFTEFGWDNDAEEDQQMWAESSHAPEEDRANVATSEEDPPAAALLEAPADSSQVLNASEDQPERSEDVGPIQDGNGSAKYDPEENDDQTMTESEDPNAETPDELESKANDEEVCDQVTECMEEESPTTEVELQAEKVEGNTTRERLGSEEQSLTLQPDDLPPSEEPAARRGETTPAAEIRECGEPETEIRECGEPETEIRECGGRKTEIRECGEPETESKTDPDPEEDKMEDVADSSRPEIKLDVTEARGAEDGRPDTHEAPKTAKRKQDNNTDGAANTTSAEDAVEEEEKEEVRTPITRGRSRRIANKTPAIGKQSVGPGAKKSRSKSPSVA